MVKHRQRYHPQEIEVWYVLPAIRRELAKAMIERGVMQKRIAKILGVTEATISHYVKDKRGKRVELSKRVREEIRKSTQAILKDQYLLVDEVQKICRMIRKRKELCRIHQRFERKHKGCNICFEK
jgi:predicted transcriptional regulator